MFPAASGLSVAFGLPGPVVISSPDLLAVGSGSLVGFVLGLIGGGGSILAVPLLMYVVGIRSPHVAIGTSAIAVAVSAFANLVGHGLARNVKWPCAAVFASSGVLGAVAGSTLGKQVDGERLLALFGALMLVVSFAMFRRKPGAGDATVVLNRASAPQLGPPLIGLGAGVGALSGFFGIGGGFLVVPGLVAATRMPLVTAMGSSLVAVTAFGLTTAASYAWSGLVDWHVAGLFVGGGIAGGLFGRRAAMYLAARRNTLSNVFAAIVAVVGIYVVSQGWSSFSG